MDIDACSRYLAEKQLYDALILSDSYDYNVDKYEAIYANESSTNEELINAANTLNSSLTNSNKISRQEWSDYPILFEGNWTFLTSQVYSPEVWVAETNLKATVDVNQDATLVFDYSRPSSGLLNVYVDDELYQTIIPATFDEESRYYNKSRYFVDLSSGKHEIRWSFSNNNPNSSNRAYLYNFGVLNSRTITVNLLEPGSLGTEVLKEVDHIKNVRKLVINGGMNDDDWARILMMPYLLSLDLSGTTITSITSQRFSCDNFGFLHSVKLPETITEIGYRAFYNSYIEDLIIPTSIKTIGDDAFYNTRITEAMLPNDMTSVGSAVFENCYFLTKANFPASLTTMPSRLFHHCERLTDLTIHDGLKVLNLWAMRYVPYSHQLPSSVTTINEAATADNPALTEIIIPENCTYMGLAAFQGCSNVKYVELPVGYYDCSGGRNLFNFWSLETLVIKSPTMLTGSQISSIVPSGRRSSITLKVPDYLVNTYKQDSYWYEYGKIEGFSTADIKDWYINQPLTLGADARIAGLPNIHMERSGSIKISGDAPMTIDDLWTCKDWNAGEGWNTMLLSTCDNISINGKFTHRVYTPSKRWVFICLPFDTKVGDITSESSFAIRYYDGANRAENGSGGNWKNYSKDDIIPAGTGFILQTSKECSTWFTAQDNTSKQYVFQNKEFVKALEANASENNANKGWNLVGNPWLSYYNIHKVNFTAPITCWNISKSTYTAYSIIDDDYAILPGEAFFVQCPDEINSISFPIDGRQLTSVIESQNGARPFGELQASSRKLIDIELTDGEMADKTRFVLNPQAKIDYETTCDASKFFSMDNSVPQIYTIQNGVQMAINERPAGDGIVKLGMTIPADGTYTIQSVRNDLTNAVLVDLQNGTETNLSTDSYTFSAKGGTNDSRFELRLSGSSSTTGISDTTRLLNDEAIRNSNIYNLNGQRISAPQKGIYVVNGKKVINK